MPTDDKAQSKILQVRTALNDAYAALEGQRSVESFGAFTYEDAIAQQLERIEGNDSARRPNELHRVERTVAQVRAAAAAIQGLSPSLVDRDPTGDP